jgi:hypothetical protein
MRAGIATCAVDLPGHGERLNADLQRSDRAFDVVRRSACGSRSTRGAAIEPG